MIRVIGIAVVVAVVAGEGSRLLEDRRFEEESEWLFEVEEKELDVLEQVQGGI